MSRFRLLPIAAAAAIMFVIGGGTAYAGAVKPQPLGANAPAYDFTLVRGGGRGGGHGGMHAGGRPGGHPGRPPSAGRPGGGRPPVAGRPGGGRPGARPPHQGGRPGARPPHRGPGFHGRPPVGTRYRGGVWFGPHGRHWGGRWWPYGVGSCWRWTPIGFVWICS